MAVFLKYEGEGKTISNKTEFMIAGPPIGQKEDLKMQEITRVSKKGEIGK